MIIPIMMIAGGLGAVARFVSDGLIRTVLGRNFPWATLCINVVGAFILGIVTGYALHHAAADIKLVIGTGFCGGFTTFSTASFEAVRLIEEKRFGAFWLQFLGNAVLSLGAAAVGLLVLPF